MEEIVEVRKSRKAVDTATGAVDNDGRSSPPVSPTGQIIKTHKRARHFFFFLQKPLELAKVDKSETRLVSRRTKTFSQRLPHTGTAKRLVRTKQEKTVK